MRNFGCCTGTIQKLPKGQDPNQQEFLGVFMQIHLTGECLRKRGLGFPGFSREVPQVVALWSKRARLYLKMAGQLWVMHMVPVLRMCAVRMKRYGGEKPRIQKTSESRWCVPRLVSLHAAADCTAHETMKGRLMLEWRPQKEGTSRKASGA